MQIGDRITFVSPTRWAGFAKATRIITGFSGIYPTVRYGGYGDFIVRLDEIKSPDPTEKFSA